MNWFYNNMDGVNFEGLVSTLVESKVTKSIFVITYSLCLGLDINIYTHLQTFSRQDIRKQI